MYMKIYMIFNSLYIYIDLYTLRCRLDNNVCTSGNCYYTAKRKKMHIFIKRHQWKCDEPLSGKPRRALSHSPVFIYI